MKIKVELEHDETPELADDRLEKALQAKKECSHEERYDDEILNDFHSYICRLHKEMLERASNEIKGELTRASSARYT